MSYKKILFRRDTAANWVSENPVLSAGEIGLETDGNKIKLGNGSTAWNSLSYFYGTIEGVTLNDLGDVTITSASSGEFLRWNGSAWINDAINLGTDTVGNYMSDVTQGTGVTVTHTPGEASSATIAIGQSVGTSDSPSFAGVTADGIQIGISASLEIDTTAGNLTIDSAGGTVTIDDNLVVTGDFTVSGTTTTVNTETINLADNLIVLNSNESGAPSQNAGIEIERGSSTNVALRWNESSDKWEITEDGSTYVDIATTGYVDAQSIAALDDIGDVTITSASAGQFLKWNGSAWVNDEVPLINTLDDVGDVTITSASAGQFLKWNGSAWINDEVPLINTLDDVGDVTITSASAGQFLKWNGSAWINDEVPLINTLDDVGDVTITSASAGQFLKWNGSAWINDEVPLINTLDDVGDVTITSAANGEFLNWNGSAWVNDSIPTINTLDDVGDVTITSVSTGQIVQWNGSAWINSSSVRNNEIKFLMEVI